MTGVGRKRNGGFGQSKWRSGHSFQRSVWPLSPQTSQSGCRDDWAMIDVSCQSPSIAMLFEPQRNLGSASCPPLRKNGLEVVSQRFECAQARQPKSPPRSRRQKAQAQSRAFRNGGRRLYGLEDNVLAAARNTICCRSVLLRKHSCAPTCTHRILSTLAPTLY
jgi:hypothetical protein